MLSVLCKHAMSVLSSLALKYCGGSHLLQWRPVCNFLFGVVALQINFLHHRPLSPLTGLYSLPDGRRPVLLDATHTYMLRLGAISFFLCYSPSHLPLGLHFSVSLAYYCPFLFCAPQIFSLYFNYFWDIFHSGFWGGLQNLLLPPLPSLLFKLHYWAGTWSKITSCRLKSLIDQLTCILIPDSTCKNEYLEAAWPSSGQLVRLAIRQSRIQVNSGDLLDFFSVVPNSNPRLCLYM